MQSRCRSKQTHANILGIPWGHWEGSMLWGSTHTSKHFNNTRTLRHSVPLNCSEWRTKLILLYVCKT